MIRNIACYVYTEADPPTEFRGANPFSLPVPFLSLSYNFALPLPFSLSSPCIFSFSPFVARESGRVLKLFQRFETDSLTVKRFLAHSELKMLPLVLVMCVLRGMVPCPTPHPPIDPPPWRITHVSLLVHGVLLYNNCHQVQSGVLIRQVTLDNLLVSATITYCSMTVVVI